MGENEVKANSTKRSEATKSTDAFVTTHQKHKAEELINNDKIIEAL